MKRVSVVIPTYRRRDSVLRAVHSALNQTYPNVEVLVVDDNGEGTAEQLQTEAVLRDLIERRAISYIVQARNSGANAARNAGINHSTGDYVAFLDDDDEWMKDKLRKQVEVMDADKDIGVVYTRMILRYGDLNLQYATRPRARGYIHSQLLIENYVGAMTSVLIRRAALSEHCFDESLPARQDYDLWLRLSIKWKFEIIDEVLAVVHARNSSTRITSHIDNYINAIRIIDRKYASELDQLSDYLKVLRKSEQCYFLGSQAIKANRLDLARKYFAESLKARISVKSMLALVLSFFGVRATIYARALQSALHR